MAPKRFEDNDEDLNNPFSWNSMMEYLYGGAIALVVVLFFLLCFATWSVL